MYKSIILFLIAFLLSLTTNAQTIINTERVNHTDSLVLALSLTHTGSYGNATINKFDISPVFIRTGIQHDFKFFGGYSVLSNENSNILNSGFVHVRHNFKFNNQFKTFEFYQTQYNEVLLLNKREVFGLGIRRSIIQDSVLSFDLGSGIMMETEILDASRLPAEEKTETQYLRATIVCNIELNTRKLWQLNSVTYYQPYLGNVMDYRLLQDINIQINLHKNINLLLVETLRFDSEPPTNLSTYDLSSRIGLNINL